MTVSSAFPPVSSDSLLASENLSHSSQQNHRRILEKLLEKRVAFSKRGIHLLPVLALCTALCGMACASIFIVIAEQELSPIATAFNRLLIATIAFALWNTLQSLATRSETNPLQTIQPEATSGAEVTALDPEDQTRSRLGSLTLLIIAGLCFATSLSLSAWSLTQTSVANSALLNNMMPIFTTLGAWLFLGQRFSPKFLMGLAVAIGGVITIGLQDFHVAASHSEPSSGHQIMGDAAALLAAVLLAITLLSVERLRDRFSTSTIMMGMSLTGSLAIFPVLCWSQSPLFPTSWTSGLAVLGLALVSQVTGHGLLTYSLKHFSSGLVSVSMLAIPILATVLAMVLFAQPLSLLNGIAFLVVLSGIYLAISAPKCSQELKLEPELPTKV